MANKFEREAIFIHARIAESTDEVFVFYAKAFRWVMTAVDLFDELDYEPFESSDHFFNDHLRHMCDVAWEDRQEIELAEFERLLILGSEFQDALEFFDDLQRGRLKWDRLMALQLVLMAFINRFGYATQRSEDVWFDRVARLIEREEVARNLLRWLPKLGLGDDPEAQRISTALRRRVENSHRASTG